MSETHAHIISRAPLQDDAAVAIHVPVALFPMPLKAVLPLDEVVQSLHVVALTVPDAVVPDHHSLESDANTPASLSVVSIVPELHMESHEDFICIPDALFTGSEPEKLYGVFLSLREFVKSEKKPNATLQTPAPTLVGA